MLSLDDLSNEVLIYIFSYLKANDLSRISSTCKRFYSVVMDDVLWQTLCTEGEHEGLCIRTLPISDCFQLSFRTVSSISQGKLLQSLQAMPIYESNDGRDSL